MSKKRKAHRTLLLLEVLLSLLLLGLVAVAAEQPGVVEEPVVLCWRGEEILCPASGTVGELLAQRELEMDEKDVLSLPLSHMLQPGETVRVDRLVHRRETYTITIPAGTVYCPELSLQEGEERVLAPGMDGELLCTAEVSFVNGLETGRVITDRQLLREPEDRIIARGTGAETGKITAANGLIHLPDGQILTYSRTATLQASAYPKETGSITLSNGSLLPMGTASADPAFLPPGTRLFLISADGSYPYGIATVIPGNQIGNHVELSLPTYADCLAFGQRSCTAFFLEKD